MKNLYICRGLPGSGKSTYARGIAPIVIEPDMFRYDADNRYVFDSDMNADVIRKAQDLCEYAMLHLMMPCIAVTAAFVRVDHLMEYVRIARRHGYAVTVVECSGSFGNVHGVPDSVIRRMREEFEPLDAELADQEGISLWSLRQGILYEGESE